MAGERWRLGRQPALDGVRGLAIGLVLLQHGAVPHMGMAGRVGVTVFFVLSGFLITSLLLEERAETGRISLRGFYARRVRRLGPALVVALAGAVALALVAPRYLESTMRGIVLTLTYLGNWQMANHGPAALGILTGTWSLAVEEQFYLVWPIVLVVALRFGVQWVAIVAWAGVAASLAARLLLVAGDASDARVYYGTDTNAVALLAGVLLAVYLHRSRAPRSWPAWVPLGVLLVVAAAPTSLLDFATLTAVAASVVLLRACATGGGEFLTADWLRWLGRRSYALYLWNCMFAIAVYDVPMPWVARLAVTAGPALVLAALSWRFVESPFLRRRSRKAAPRRLVVAASPAR